MELSLKRNPVLEKLGFFRTKTKETETGKKILETIDEVKNQLEAVESKFNLCCEDELIESLIYEERALKARYAYLMSEAKRFNINNTAVPVKEK